MNKKILIIIGILILLVIGMVIFLLTKHTSTPKELELIYKKSAGIPFKWEYEIKDPTIVEFVDSYVVKDENKDGKVGAPVYTKYVFKGIKKGKTTITFKLVSITNDDYPSEEDINTVIVDDDLNIKLITE